MPNTRFMLWVVLGADPVSTTTKRGMHDYREPAARSCNRPPVPRSASAAQLARHSVSDAEAPPSSARRRQPRRHAGQRAACGALRQTGPRLRRAAAVGRHPPASCTSSPMSSIWTSACAAARSIAADLPQYPLHKDTPNVPVRLENSDPAALYLLQTRSRRQARAKSAPSHLATLDRRTELLRAAVPGANGAARADDLDGRPGLDRDQDIRVHARRVRDRSRL